jgi:hypothetical protein
MTAEVRTRARELALCHELKEPQSWSGPGLFLLTVDARILRRAFVFYSGESQRGYKRSPVILSKRLTCSFLDFTMSDGMT